MIIYSLVFLQLMAWLALFVIVALAAVIAGISLTLWLMGNVTTIGWRFVEMRHKLLAKR